MTPSQANASDRAARCVREAFESVNQTRAPLDRFQARELLALAASQHGRAPLTDEERGAAVTEALRAGVGYSHRLPPVSGPDSVLHAFPPGAGEARGTSGTAGAGGRDGLVTRPEILTGEKKPAQHAPSPFFVDWLSISQDHSAGGLPEVHAGAVWAADEAGEIKWRTIRAVRHEGSHGTSVTVRCDGHRVEVRGNVGRFGRADNVFGFDFWRCLQTASEIAAAYGLPPFTAGQRMEYVRKGAIRSAWTGARVSRLDLTANYCAGSPENARLVMQWLGSQRVGRKTGAVLGDGETVEWGGGRRQYWKVYDKAVELVKHAGKDRPLDSRLVEWCRDSGLIRLEGTVRSNALTDLGAAYLGDYESGWAMGQLVNLFNEHAAVMTRAECSTDDLSELPVHLRATARDYLAGDDPRKGRSQATWYRHRLALLPYGIDIAVRNVSPFKPRVRVVELAPAQVPVWYQLAAA